MQVRLMPSWGDISETPNFCRAAMEIQLRPHRVMGFTMFRIVLVAAATLALAGCASSQSETQALFRSDDAKCKSYERGTDAYVQCRLAINIQRANTEAAAAPAPRR